MTKKPTMRELVSFFLTGFVALFIAGAGAAVLFGADHGSAQTIGPDKYMHVAGSAALSTGALLLIDRGHAPESCKDRRKLCAFAAALSVGVVKELLPYPLNHGFDWQDIAADAIGAAAGIWLHGIIIRPRFVGYTTTF